MESELSRPGYRQYIEKRADGSVWQVEEYAHNVHGLLLHQYYKAWKIAHDRGLPLPPPPVSDEASRDEVLICVTRSERRLGVRWKEADGCSNPTRAAWCSRSIHGANVSLTPHFEGADAQRMAQRKNECFRQLISNDSRLPSWSSGLLLRRTSAPLYASPKNVTSDGKATEDRVVENHPR